MNHVFRGPHELKCPRSSHSRKKAERQIENKPNDDRLKRTKTEVSKTSSDGDVGENVIGSVDGAVNAASGKRPGDEVVPPSGDDRSKRSKPDEVHDGQDVVDGPAQLADNLASSGTTGGDQGVPVTISQIAGPVVSTVAPTGPIGGVPMAHVPLMIEGDVQESHNTTPASTGTIGGDQGAPVVPPTVAVDSEHREGLNAAPGLEAPAGSQDPNLILSKEPVDQGGDRVRPEGPEGHFLPAVQPVVPLHDHRTIYGLDDMHRALFGAPIAAPIAGLIGTDGGVRLELVNLPKLNAGSYPGCQGVKSGLLVQYVPDEVPGSKGSCLVWLAKKRLIVVNNIRRTEDVVPLADQLSVSYLRSTLRFGLFHCAFRDDFLDVIFDGLKAPEDGDSCFYASSLKPLTLVTLGDVRVALCVLQESVRGVMDLAKISLADVDTINERDMFLISATRPAVGQLVLVEIQDVRDGYGGLFRAHVLSIDAGIVTVKYPQVTAALCKAHTKVPEARVFVIMNRAAVDAPLE